MKNEPEIIKELREAEKFGRLQSKVQEAYKELEVVEELSNDIPDESVGFVEDDVEKKQEGANINNEKLPWKSEEKWRLLLENLPNIVMLVDRDGIIQYINHTVPGLTPDQVIGKNHIEFIPPEHHDIVKETIEQVFQTGNVSDYEIKGAGPKGNISWYASRIGPIKSDGQVAAVSITTSDITEKKQTEFKLGERLKEFRCLYNITNSIRSEKTLEELLGETTGYIQEAWQYPEITRCKIIFDGKEYINDKFEETKFKQTADIIVDGKTRGIIEVYYLKEMPESDEGPFLKEERRLLDEVASYLGTHAEKKEMEEGKNKILYDMGERVKELDCLYGITKLVENPDNTLEEILQGIVDLIPPSWQYPDVTCARIVFDGREFKTSNFKETKWKQSSEITVNSEKKGAVEVFYTVEKPESYEGPFLKEERLLIEGIAKQLGAAIKRIKVEGELHRSAEEWKTTFDSISDLVSMQDKNCMVLNANKAYMDTFNLQKEELIGKHCYEIVHGAKEPFPGCPHLQTLKTNKPVTAEFFEPHLGIFLEVSTSPVFDENGKVTGTTHIAKNITERKEVENNLKNKIDELERYKKLTVNRELKMAEMKKRIEELKGNQVK